MPVRWWRGDSDADDLNDDDDDALSSRQLGARDFTRCMDDLALQLKEQWRGMTGEAESRISDYGSGSGRCTGRGTDSGDGGTITSEKSFSRLPRSVSSSASAFRSADRFVVGVEREMRRFQAELVTSARLMATNAQTAIDLQQRMGGSRTGMAAEAVAFEAQLRALESEGASWLASRATRTEEHVKALQNRVAATNLVYEELVSKRRDSLHYSAMNDRTLAKVLSYLDPQVYPFHPMLHHPRCFMCAATTHQPVLDDPVLTPTFYVPLYTLHPDKPTARMPAGRMFVPAAA